MHSSDAEGHGAHTRQRITSTAIARTSAGAAAFVYPRDTDDEAADAIVEGRLELLRGVHAFISQRVISRRHGKLPEARTIAVRLVVLHELLSPSGTHNMAALARELGCSRAWLSKVAIEFSDSIGMRASWQRISSREVYRKRAAGVHAGTWQPGAKRQRYLARQQKLAVARTVVASVAPAKARKSSRTADGEAAGGVTRG